MVEFFSAEMELSVCKEEQEHTIIRYHFSAAALLANSLGLPAYLLAFLLFFLLFLTFSFFPSLHLTSQKVSKQRPVGQC